MKKLKAKIAAYISRHLDNYRRRRLKVRIHARTRDHRNVVRDYTIVAVPRTLEKRLYDVRIKRVALGGSNVEILEQVWTPEHLRNCLHASN